MPQVPILITISVFLSATYFFRTFADTRLPLDRWLKAGGCVILALAAIINPDFPPLVGLLLASALALSALGDLLLGFVGSLWFKRGLVAFLTAHVIYAGLFLSLAPAAWWYAIDVWLIAMALTMAVVLLLAGLWRGLRSMRRPVIFYCLAIMAMIVAAAASGNRMLLIAALLFAFSDTLIAVREFRQPFRYANQAIWLTYYSAQLMIFLVIA